MRILRLDLDTGEELDLHPYVTVLGGLDPGLQRRVADQLANIARGQVDGIGGLIEAHGMLVDISPHRIEPLHLPAEADIVVEAEQLPGAQVLQAEAGENQHHRALLDKIESAEAELIKITSEITRVTDYLQRDTAELDDARRALDEFAVTAHESAIRAVQEAESLARRRIEATGALPAAPEPAPYAPEDHERDRIAEELAGLRSRHHHIETMLDEERLGLLQLLEQLETEHTTLEALRAELAAETNRMAEGETDQAPQPEPEPAVPDEPALPDLADMAAVDALIREVAAGPADAPMVPSLPAAALADQVAAHRQRQREFERELLERGMDPGVIRERLAQARRAEADAAAAARPRTVSPEDDREIERLHDIVTENSEKRTSRRGGKEATRLWEEASEQLDELLGRYGFPTYASFIMGRTAPAIDEEARRHHQEVKALVASIERELDEVAVAIEQDPHGRMLKAERDQLWDAAYELLGSLPDDIEGALRNLRVPGAVVFDAPDRLRDLLRRLGVDVADAGSTGRLLETADAWYNGAQAAHAQAEATRRYQSQASDPLGDIRLPAGFTASEAAASTTSAGYEQRIAEQEAVVADLVGRSKRLDDDLTAHESEAERLTARISAIEAELVSLDEARAATRASAESQRAAEAAARPDPAAMLEEALAVDPTVLSAREQAALTAARLERHHVAVENVDRLHASIGTSRKHERELTAQRDSLQIEIDTLRSEVAKLRDSGTPLPPIRWHLTDEGVGPIEWYLLGRVASLRSVAAAGSVPLVLNDVFRGLPSREVGVLCAALARIGETVQVIYLGDELAVSEWAQAQGLDQAAVVRPGQPAI